MLIHPGPMLMIKIEYRARMAKHFPEYVAKLACKDEILRVANDPDSIEWVDPSLWPAKEEWRESGDTRVYVVAATVRGTNAFGAKVRSHARCEVAISDTFVYARSATLER